MTEVGDVSGLRRMAPKNDIAQEEIRKLIGYLINNRDRSTIKVTAKAAILLAVVA